MQVGDAIDEVLAVCMLGVEALLTRPRHDLWSHAGIDLKKKLLTRTQE